ncbi:hypothetical protein [Sporosarcina sp. YIM B06819]|uniref:hypothetical protein n=1 Tax=Sporosarcina sp. YIM B06819 TaxID=3081769 RepID=UPI00298D5ACD|nr:hypothetical protein [Sporosarcina sp. YIM B06819]
MSIIPEEAIPHFENMIYLPMIIKILERDRGEIEIGSFKLKKPYLDMIEGALKAARNEMKQTTIYLKRNNMNVIKRLNDGTFTEYLFQYKGYENHRKYLNIRLRNRTEELMGVYFVKYTEGLLVHE